VTEDRGAVGEGRWRDVDRPSRTQRWLARHRVGVRTGVVLTLAAAAVPVAMVAGSAETWWWAKLYIALVWAGAAVASWRWVDVAVHRVRLHDDGPARAYGFERRPQRSKRQPGQQGQPQGARRLGPPQEWLP
jgi:hypothetical protein